MTREILSDGENLFFIDYAKRKLRINQNDYLNLMRSEERRVIRPILEECLQKPTEVWWMVEELEGETYSYYKYIKLYSNLVFIAYVIIDERLNFSLNNFFAYNEDEFHLADNERRGQLILSNLKK